MENYVRKIKCDACNKYYTIKYMQFHKTTLKHIENEMEYNVEEEIENHLKDFFYDILKSIPPIISLNGIVIFPSLLEYALTEVLVIISKIFFMI